MLSSKAKTKDLYDTIAVGGGSKKYRKILDVSLPDLLSNDNDNSQDPVSMDEVFFNREALSESLRIDIDSNVTTTMRALQDILFATDDCDKKVNGFSKNILYLQKSQYCKALRLCRKLLYHMLQTLNPAAPFALLEKLTVRDFLKDNRYKTEIPDEISEKVSEEATNQRKLIHLQEVVIPEIKKHFTR
jgi:hypothetical protein